MLFSASTLLGFKQSFSTVSHWRCSLSVPPRRGYTSPYMSSERGAAPRGEESTPRATP
jgi:hypothetical protein